jgi:hypothetical protein
MDTVTVDQLCAIVAQNAKSKKWISCTFKVQTDRGVFPVGVKAYGLWVQRVECLAMCDGVPEQKTQRALRAQLAELLTRMLSRA